MNAAGPLYIPRIPERGLVIRLMDMPGEKTAMFMKTAKAAVAESINRGGVLVAKLGITVFPNNWTSPEKVDTPKR